MIEEIEGVAHLTQLEEFWVSLIHLIHLSCGRPRQQELIIERTYRSDARLMYRQAATRYPTSAPLIPN